MKTTLHSCGALLALWPALALSQPSLPAAEAAKSEKASINQPNAQSESIAGTPTPADRKWDETLESSPPASPVGVKLDADALRARASAFAAYADKLKAFRLEFPSDMRAHVARRQEAIALISAERLGDNSQRVRRDILVTEARSDSALPGVLRLGVAARAENFAVEKLEVANREERLANYEQVARRLIQEFPDVDGSYAALFNIGRDGTPENMVRIAGDLAEMEAPAQIKAAAAALVARQALVGQSLKALTVKAELPAGSVPTLGAGGALLYTWSTGSRAAMALVRRLAAAKPGVAIIGVNLDTRVVSAQVVAATEELPGAQIYDPRGSEGAFAKALLLTEVPLVYRVDEHGVISSVTAWREFPSAPATAASTPAAP